MTASSSSSGANIGSPKPEKRQANSPLPPPPPSSASPDMAGPKNLDDMYAKVHKTKKKVDVDIDSEVFEEKKKVAVTKDEGDGGSLRREHNYETLRKLSRECSDPGYEKIKSEPGYASINGPDSITSSDPGYEVLRQNAPPQSDPNYEELRHCDVAMKNLMDGYSTVNKPKKLSNFNEEPNYESMPAAAVPTPIEDNYKSNGSESDPNYESVKYLEVEPPYERLQDDDGCSTKSDEKLQSKCDECYETVDGGDEPPYERVNNENPGYETIKRDGGGEVDEFDGIVQV